MPDIKFGVKIDDSALSKLEARLGAIIARAKAAQAETNAVGMGAGPLPGTAAESAGSASSMGGGAPPAWHPFSSPPTPSQNRFNRPQPGPPTPPPQPGFLNSMLPGGGAAGYAGGFIRGALGLSVLAGGGYLAGEYLKHLVGGEAARRAETLDISQQLGIGERGFNAFTERGYLGFGPGASTAFAATMAGRAGTTRLGGGLAGIREGMRLTRAFGMSSEEGAETFGTVGRQFGSANMEKFAALMAEAVKKGSMGGLQGEVFQSILEVNKELQRRLGLSSDATLKFMSPLLSTVAQMNKAGVPGWLGAGAMGALEGISAGLQGHPIVETPSGLAQAMMLKAAGKMGIPFKDLQNLIAQGPAGGTQWLKYAGEVINQTSSLPSIMRLPLLNDMGMPLDQDALTKLQGILSSGGTLSSPQAQKILDDNFKKSQAGSAATIRNDQAKIEASMAKLADNFLPVMASIEGVLVTISGYLATIAGIATDKEFLKHPYDYVDKKLGLKRAYTPEELARDARESGVEARFLTGHPEMFKGYAAKSSLEDRIRAAEKKAGTGELVDIEPDKSGTMLIITYRGNAKHPKNIVGTLPISGSGEVHITK